MKHKIVSGNKSLDLSKPVVMGILNATPDSFSDGGQFNTFDTAMKHAQAMIEQGAQIIDVGGESTRPGAPDVSLKQELSRVIPVVESLSKKDVWISIDTSKAEVMRQAVAAGAHLINDVRALQEPDALAVAASLDVPVCLMHMQGTPRTMQENPEYHDVVEDISQFFEQRIQACIAAGIKRENLILDPGFGFGKTLQNNIEILAKFAEFKRFNLPLLSGLSRKSMFAHLLNRDVEHRLAGSLAGAMISAQNGAQIIRVHDVAETVDVLATLSAVMAWD